jgi:hypothetical protein
MSLKAEKGLKKRGPVAAILISKIRRIPDSPARTA